LGFPPSLRYGGQAGFGFQVSGCAWLPSPDTRHPTPVHCRFQVLCFKFQVSGLLGCSWLFSLCSWLFAFRVSVNSL